MKSWFMIMSTLMLLASGEAYADGNELLQQCELAQKNQNNFTKAEFVQVARCLGYVEGVSMTLRTFSSQINNHTRYCIPQAPAGQFARVVVSYLKSHPENLHYDDFSLTFTALTTAFPCTP